jgi:hypothetical protein
MPSTTTRPDAARWSPATTRSSDDFPDPEGPATTVNRDRPNAASTFCRAWTAPEAVS